MKSNDLQLLLNDDSKCSKSYDKKHDYSDLEFKCHYCDRISYVKLLKVVYWVGFTLQVGNRWHKRGDGKDKSMNMWEIEAKNDIQGFYTMSDIKNKIKSEYNTKDFMASFRSSNLHPSIESKLNQLIREIDGVITNF